MMKQTVSAATQGGPRTSVRPQWRRAMWWPAQTQSYLAVWVVGVLVVGAALTYVLWSWRGSVDRSLLQNLFGTGIWFTFAFTIVTLAGLLPVHVAAGLTRRSFTRAMLVVSALTGLGYGLGFWILLQAEGVVYGFFDWPQVIGGRDSRQAHWEVSLAHGLTAYLIAYLAAQASALIVGITYYRFGGLRATLLLPVTAVPLALVMILMTEASTWNVGPLSIDTTSPMSYLLCAAIAVAYAVAFSRLSRSVPIHTR